MKNNSSNIVLSIFPNYKGFGYVCLQEPNVLIDYGVISVIPFCSSKILKRFNKTLSYLKPTIIVLRNCEGQKGNRSKRIDNFLSKVKSISQLNNLPVFEYTRDEIKEAFFELNVSTKYEIAKQLVKQFPELESYLPKPRAFYEHESYYQVMFDALSMVIPYLEENKE